MAGVIPEPNDKCTSCGDAMVAWVGVAVSARYMKPEDIGTMNMRLRNEGQRWCLDCIRGKNYQKWLHAKPWQK